MMRIRKQAGVTLVEIAIVLVIIGLLLGGLLKGQELISSARVRNLADQNSGIQAAYYGFIDRYRQVPGDWENMKATRAIGQTVNLPTKAATTDNGRLDNTYMEATALWEQLAKAQFLGGGFTPATAVPTEATYVSNQVGPHNAFNGALILTRNAGYTGANPAIRLNLHMGRNVPVNIARELDVKVDDGLPNTGVLRLSEAAGANGGGTTFDTEFTSRLAECSTANTSTASNQSAATENAMDIYDIYDDYQDCPQVFIY